MTGAMISETAKELGIQLYITTFISKAVIQVLILGVVLLRTLFSFTFMFFMEYNLKKTPQNFSIIYVKQK